MTWSRGRFASVSRVAFAQSNSTQETPARQWQAMSTLSRLRIIQVPLARANSTLTTSSSVTSTVSTPRLTPTSSRSDASPSFRDAQSAPSSPPKRRTQGRRNPKYPPIRPSISLERPREWNPPVPPDFIPAYDEAVAYIRADAAALQAEVDALRSNMEKGPVSMEGVEDTKKRLDTLEIMAQVNLPEVRWKAANGMGQFF
jgi:large subunit ribosomal protein L35